MANFIVRVLLRLEALRGEAGDIRPETLVKGGLELDIDTVLECRPVVSAVHRHVGAVLRLVSCDQSNRTQSDLSDEVKMRAGEGGREEDPMRRSRYVPLRGYPTM